MSYPDLHGDQSILSSMFKELGFFKQAKMILQTKNYKDLYDYADVLKEQIKKRKREDMMIKLFKNELASFSEVRNV